MRIRETFRATDTAGGGVSTAQRAVLALAVDGDLRFLSHHDELRMLTRALTRAGWPLAYSQGFNPLARVRLPLPRSVGTAARAQWVLVDLTEPRPADALAAALVRSLPAGGRLLQIVTPAPRVTPHPRRVTYRVPVAETDPDALAAQIAEVLAATELWIERDRGPQRARQRMDIRPYVDNITLADGTLRMDLGFRDQRTVRPVELLIKLGLAADVYAHRVQRDEIQWDIEFPGQAERPATQERE